MKKIAFIDFDGTIYNGDSMLEFAKTLKGNSFVRTALIKSSFNIILKKLKLRSSQKAKEQFLGYVLSNVSEEAISEAVSKLTESFDERIYKAASEELDFLKNEQAEIVIVSASCELWLKPWCDQKGFTLIASKLKKTNKGYTGQLEGKNCKGDEKVKRIKELYNLSDYSDVYCYGNDASDLPMVGLATHETKVLYR